MPIWFVLNYIPRVHSQGVKQARKDVETYNRRNGTSLELFTPTIRQTRIRHGREEIIERPLTFHYVFLLATESRAKELCSLDNGFSFVLNRSGGDQRYATVSESAMAAFRRIALNYGNALPFFSIEDVDLSEGDRIEIVDGEFAGLTGTYLPRPRSASGNVIIESESGFASVIFNVKASYIRVIEFAKNTRRHYDLIDAFTPRLLKAKATVESGSPLSEKQLTDLILFTRRMETARLDNHKIEAKLLALLIAAKQLLGADASALQPLLTRFEKRRNTITNPQTRALLQSILNFDF